MTFREELVAAARASQRPLDAGVIEACARHFDLLLRWNQTHNLTRIVAAPEAARKHYLDCLVPLMDARDGGLVPASFVDVGSGAGFPGLLACLVWPDARATLVEPAQKRASFLMLAAQAMGAKVTIISSVDETPRAKGRTARAKTMASSGESDEITKDAAADSAGLGAAVVLSRATFSPGKRSELVRAAGDGIAVWGHHHDAATWQGEVATWGAWHAAELAYLVDGLEPRSLLWATRGGFHVKHTSSIP
jgi:16S rRNA (guanine(527)-N(7))-methyltransferase RsmG